MISDPGKMLICDFFFSSTFSTLMKASVSPAALAETSRSQTSSISRISSARVWLSPLEGWRTCLPIPYLSLPLRHRSKSIF